MTTTTTQDSANASAGDGGTAERGRLAAVSDSAAEAYRATRERTSTAYAAARERAGAALERTGDGIEANPMAAVFAGLALGALAAALIPRTRREEELLGDVGRRITDTARDAARAAREAGREQIDELGLNRDGVRRRLDEFTDRAVGAVKGSAGDRAGK
jgi:ElaB/YqjD/DUF883 family membrane-anchored ribosome-binding protein